MFEDVDPAYIQSLIFRSKTILGDFIQEIQGSGDEEPFDEDELETLFIFNCLEKLLPLIILGLMALDENDKDTTKICFHRSCFLEQQMDENNNELPYIPELN